MGGHAAWRKRVARGELAKGLGGAIMRHRPHRGRKGKDLVLNRKGHIGGGNPKKRRRKANDNNTDEDHDDESPGIAQQSFGGEQQSMRQMMVILLCIPIAYLVGYLFVYRKAIMGPILER